MCGLVVFLCTYLACLPALKSLQDNPCTHVITTAHVTIRTFHGCLAYPDYCNDYLI